MMLPSGKAGESLKWPRNKGRIRQQIDLDKIIICHNWDAAVMSAACVAAMRSSASFQQYSFISFMQKCLNSFSNSTVGVYGVQTKLSHPTQYLHYKQFSLWK